MRKIIIALLFFAGNCFAQKPNEIKKWYTVSASELIFSTGDLEIAGESLDKIIRFSAFFHLQQQAHYDFSSYLGMFTGFGIRNVGFIHTTNFMGKELKFKHRSYSAGIPLALKIGNFEKGFYLALGGEAELMFNYKRKLFYDGEKVKKTEWFSDKVNMFNPSLFADIRFSKGSYIRFKYYLFDFLSEKESSFIVPGTIFESSYKPEKSSLFYIAIGKAFKVRDKKKHHASKKDV